MSDIELLPAIGFVEGTDSSALDRVWVRVSAFLALKTPNTQRTYSSVISEWCKFLKIEPGAPGSAEKFIAVNEMHALTYRKWLETRPGQKPRLKSNSVSSNVEHSTPDLDIEVQASKTKLPGRQDFSKIKNSHTNNKKRDGLQSTLGNATIAKKLVVLRRIYRQLISAGLFKSSNPFDSEQVPVPPVRSGRKRPTEMIPYEVVRELMELPDTSCPKGLRDKCIMVLLFGAGLRRSEVLALRLGDIRETTRGTHYVRLRATKGKVDADQTIPAWAADWVKKLIELRKQQGAAEIDFLINTYRGRGGQTPGREQLSDSGLYKLFCSYCVRLGIKLSVSPHSARATAITRLLDDGFSHREVQEFSRHASVQMVEVYDKRRLGVEKNPGKNIKY